ncbi:SurA N-terminal domain-containing protein [bacterium]|nr:SurA N-terminal domain-containing protein [bacterium]
MLDILRKKSSSIVVKTILGLIVVVFVFYFGTSTLRRTAGHPANILARVNGYEITEGDLQSFIRLKKENDPMFANINDEFLQMIRGSLIEGLIQERIMLQGAQKAGIVVSDPELIDSIRKYPAFQKDGQFNAEGYNNFKPIFNQRYGMDFEPWMRNNLVRDKLLKSFENTVIVTENEAKKAYEAQNTTIKLKDVLVALKDIPNFAPDDKKLNELIATKKTDMADLNAPVDDAKIKEEALGELKNQAIAAENKKLSEELWPLFTKGNNLDAEIKKYGLTQKETEPVSIANAGEVFSNVNDITILAQIFTLSKDKPYPPSPVEGEDGYHFYKFISRTSPEWDKFKAEETIAEVKKQMAMDSFSAWLKDAEDSASIKRYF